MNQTLSLPRWSLEDLKFDDPEALEAALAGLETQLTAIEACRAQLSADLPVNAFLDLLHRLEDLYDLTSRLGGYAFLKFAGNTQDPAALSLQDRISEILTGAQNRTLFFSLWFKSLPDEAAQPYIEAAGDPGYYLQALRRFKPYTLSEAEEKVINLKDTNGTEGLEKIYEIITNGFTFRLEVDGEEKTLTRDELTRYYHSPSPEIRAATYQELFRVYAQQKTALAQIYALLVRDWKAEAVDLRGYASPISVRNLRNNLPDAVVDTLLAVCRQNTVLFQRYFGVKARLLGVERLRRYDIYAPLARAEKTYEFQEAMALILDTFRQFSPRMEQAATSVLAQSHLDAQARPGKRGGAFNYGITPKLLPWVLVNYTGRLRDVATLTHELGHAVHSILASDHSILTHHASLPLAETASVFGEMLVTDRLLREESDPVVQRDLLMTILDDAYATVQRQAFFSIFERDAHAMIASGSTSEDLAQHYLANLAEQFGETVAVSEEFAWEWTAIPHIYGTPFYTYAYSFGQLLVLALYQQYLESGEAFIPRYLRLLSAGGSAAPQTILAEAGLDVSTADFWQGGFDVLQSRLDRLEKISGEGE